MADTIMSLYSNNLRHNLLLYFTGQTQDIRDLEERITKLTIDLTFMNSERERIDRFSRHSVSTEESSACKAMKDEIQVILRKYTKFINKYTKMTKNQLSSITNQSDVFSIDRLDDLKSNFVTFSFIKLSKLSRDIVKLNRRASEAVDKLKLNHSTHKKERLNQVMFDDDNVLPMFDAYVDEVLEYLCEKGNIVGILGCRGVGKTTVLRKLYNRLLEQESLSADEKNPRLDNIIWIEYPPETEETKNVKDKVDIVLELQNEIMEQLDIRHEAAKTLTKNENTISTFLCNKKYILLMDQVSTYINLEKLGLKKSHQYKKVVICSREKKVMRRMTEHEVTIGGLKDEEALILFQNISGTFSNERQEAIAKRILECCAGIPWMIRGVANYLADNRDDDSWNSVKEILQSDSGSLEFIGVGGFDKVYEITYKGLTTETKISGTFSDERQEPNQDKLDDGGDDVLPVFNTYVLQILEYLREEGNEVGILGSKGVGKTTVLRKLYHLLIRHKSLSDDGNTEYHLDSIIWIEYPPEAETEMNENDHIVEKLQSEIMEQLEIHHEASKSIVKNANTISAFLCKKHYILLMDHVSSSVDLDDVGLRTWHKHKKVVICSREMNVIIKMTEHGVIRIQRLEKDEGWRLFESICGKLYDGRKRAIADRILESCAGIPGMISVVARHLKDKKDDNSWSYVMQILQPNKAKSLELLGLGGFGRVYEIKYQGLATNTKTCLLYGALFPHQYKIYADYLIECWIAEGFIIEKANQKVRLNRDRGQAILNHLIDEGLLQRCSGQKYEYVMMPPDFRKLALELDFPGKEKCAIWVPSKDRMPDEKTWKTVTRMSLIGCEMELPQNPQCSNISTLLMHFLIQETELLPDSFFIHMESLKVLDLNHSNIRALPRSIEKLVNLKSLYLTGCLHLDALPPEAAILKKLEFLDISGTSMPTLPKEIRCMVHMRCLRASLSRTGNQVEELISPGIISNLRNLEELSIFTAVDFGVAAAERLAEELATLEHLNSLCFYFPNVSSLNTFVTQSKALNKGPQTLQSFKIFVGRRSYEPEFLGKLDQRWFRYFTNEEFSPSCQKLLNQATYFELIGHNGLQSLTSQFNLHQVKRCFVGLCKDLINIMDGYVNVTSEKQVSLLTDLENLHLYNLNSLQCICDGPVPPTTLTNLTGITIEACHKLTEVLAPALARSLKSLKYLKVKNCHQISKIIEITGETSEIAHIPEESSNSELLPSLRKIELSNLPELKSICGSGNISISWNALKSIIVMRCSKLSNLCLTLTNASKLASIQCEESWWNTLPFPDELRLRFLPVTCFKEESINTGAKLERSELNWAREEINKYYEEDMPYADSLREEDSSDMIGAVISTADLSSSYIPEHRIEQQFSSEVAEEVIVLPVDSKTNMFGNMPISVSGFDSGSHGETEPTSSEEGRRKHQEESFTGPIRFQENGLYLVVEENNHLQLKLDNQNILIAEYPPSPAPPNGSPVNAMLSLVDQDLHELTEKPDYHNSLILLLQRNRRLTLIRSSFFDSMPALRFLDVSDTKIRILPTSVFDLLKLKVLLLRNCICLERLSPDIGKLHLEVLDLSGTELYDVPDEIGQLADVTSMHLSFYGPDDESEYENLPSQLVSPKFLSELKQLQTLSVNVHPEDHRWTEIVAHAIEDMRMLEKLSYLEFYFPQVEMFETFIQRSPCWKEQRLSKFNFTVGQNVKRIVSYVPEEVESLFSQGERCLRYVNGDKTSPLLNTALIRVTAFYLDHHTEVQSLSEFDVSNFQTLKFYVVRECPKIKTILDEKHADVAIFPHLEYLGIFSLWELMDIWKAPPEAGGVRRYFKIFTRSRNFEALRYLIIKTCPKILFILGESMLQCLANLEELVVEDCERVETIIDNKVRYKSNVLPGLRKLVLRYLPELVSLGCGDRLSEESISVYYCPKLILNS